MLSVCISGCCHLISDLHSLRMGKASLINAPEENGLLVLVPESGAAAEPKSKKTSAVEEQKESGRQIRTYTVCVAAVEVSSIIYNIARYSMFRSKYFFSVSKMTISFKIDVSQVSHLEERTLGPRETRTGLPTPWGICQYLSGKL